MKNADLMEIAEFLRNFAKVELEWIDESGDYFLGYLKLREYAKRARILIEENEMINTELAKKNEMINYLLFKVDSPNDSKVVPIRYNSFNLTHYTPVKIANTLGYELRELSDRQLKRYNADPVKFISKMLSVEYDIEA